MGAVFITGIYKAVSNFFAHMSPLKIILFGFIALILVGTLLLCLPISSRSGEGTPFLTSFFTSTSAVCVTGLIKVDTHNYWSLFGQGVILGLIQVGGMGFMTICISALSITKRKIGFASRNIMQNSVAAPQLGGIVKMTRFILLGTLTVELIGAFLLSFSFCPRYGIFKGIWYSLFHSISAFCNAGFDLMGEQGDFSSLTGYSGDWYFTTIINLLIIVGGLGFFVWRDVIACKFKFSKFRLQTKIVLTVSGGLVLVGAGLIFLLEHKNADFASQSVSQQLCDSVFQSVTTRTAGFNTMDLASLTQPSIFIMILLMLVGGSPGSTAGGMKTTTFSILVLSVASTFRRKKSTEIFGRRLEDGITRIAVSILVMYFVLATTVAITISAVDDVPLLNAFFESVSAVATVGLTTGITTHLSAVTSVMLAILMIFGRVGSMTMLLAFSSQKNRPSSEKPLEKVQIG